MGFLDRIKSLWNSSAETVKEETDKAKADLQKAALKAAANSALATAKASMAAAGEGVVGSLERELAEAEKARGKQDSVVPDGSAADDILARVKASEVDARQSIREAGVLGTMPLSRAEREAKAADELARLKAQLKAASDDKKD